MGNQQAIRGDFMTLAETKAKILSNAAALETEGLCSQEDGYQGLLNAVAQDIRHQRIHRKRRKAELKRLNRTLDNLQAKHKFYEEQVEQWDQYVKNAVAHMGQGTQTKRNFFGRKNARKQSIATGGQ